MSVAMLLDIPSMIVPDHPAVIDGDRSASYSELRDAAAQVAGLLASLGVVGGDRVGVLATNSIETVEVLFGIAFAGAVAVPMNYRAGLDEAAHLLADSGVGVLFTETRYLPLVAKVRPPTLQTVLVLDAETDADAQSATRYATARDRADPIEELIPPDDDELALLLYTSGTTSLPKGVMLRNGGLGGYVMGSNDAADGTDTGRSLLVAPLYHVAGITSLLNSLYSGRTTVLLSQFEAGSWLDAVARHGATHAFLVPTMLARVIEHERLNNTDLSTLEAITYGAAPMPPSVIRRALDRFPAHVSFTGSYGQTETTSTVAVLDPDDHRLTGTSDEVERKLRRLRSVGRVLDDVEVRIVDEAGTVLGPNETGEVQLRTARAMDGYWGKTEKTRVTIDHEGWVHTGDLGHLDEDDYLFLAGRTGDMIIRGGENIAPEEVESVLYEHPSVSEAAVVGLPDEEWGERVVAAVVLRERGAATADDLIAHCRAHLAAFKRPETVLLVDELPRTSTGKLLRRDVAPLIEPRLSDRASAPEGTG